MTEGRSQDEACHQQLGAAGEDSAAARSGQRRRVDADLLSDPRFAALLVDTAPFVLVHLDAAGRVAWFNRCFSELTGYRLTEVRHASWFEAFLPQRERAPIAKVFEMAMGGARVHANVHPLLTRSGEERLVDWFAVPLAGGSRMPAGVLCAGQDVTQRAGDAQQSHVARLEERLRQSERLATIGTTAFKFAHEVASPLNNIILRLQLLHRYTTWEPVSKEVRAGLEHIESEVRHLQQLLTEFRMLSRFQESKPEPVELSSLLDKVLDFYVLGETGARIRVERRYTSDLPRVMGHAEKLKQIVVNLCNNAVEAMPDGGTLTIAAHVQDQHIVIEVCDTGTGIADDLNPFEPFKTTKREGTGLGLPIVEQLVELHAGTITYRSSPSEGTTFEVALPLRVA